MTEAERVVSRARRGRAVFVGLVALLCFGGIAWAIVVNFEQDTKITRVERSACAQAPASAECQKVKRRSDRKRSIADTCIAFWKVGYPCPKPGSGVTAASADTTQPGADALQPADVGQETAPTGSETGTTGDIGAGHGEGTSDGPKDGTKAPAKPPAPSPQAESGSPSTDTTTDTSATTGTSTETTAPESAASAGLVGNPGGTVGEVVCSVNALGIRVCTE